MFKWLATKWVVDDSLPKEIDLLVLISYGATENRLTNGSLATLTLSKILYRQFPCTQVIFGSFSKNQNNFEQEEKQRILPLGMYVGKVSSTTDECRIIKETIKVKNWQTKNIVVVAEGSHSRRCKMVWKYFFPNSNIYFKSVPCWKAADQENPMWLQRHWHIWLIVNIIADFLVYRWKPILQIFIKINFSQPSS